MTSTAEGWGMVLTEALQMGVPIIAMDSFGALHDIINIHNGIIVPNNDINRMVGAMNTIMTDHALRKKMSMNAIESSRIFIMDNVAQQWIRLFDNIQH